MNVVKLALFTLLALGCTPGTVDYSSLKSAAEARQRAAGARLVPQDATVQSLLAQPLTAESAAGIAILNNRGLRAEAEKLGIAESLAAHARRLPNPTLEGAVKFRRGEDPELELGAMIDLTELLLLPARSGAAGADVDAAKLEAVGAIVDVSFEARRAFYAFQAAVELLELRRTVLAAFEASADLARRLREAGNVTELDFANQQALFEEARLDVRRAEIEVAKTREALRALLGLWGDTEWKEPARLSPPPERELDVKQLENAAIRGSLELAIARQRFGAAARRADVARYEGFLPELKAGVAAERDEEWAVGPAVELELPLFYQGQGRVGAAKAEMRREQELYADAAVGIRAAARGTAFELTERRESTLYYRNVLLPLKQKIVEQSQREYNAMLIGLFQLLSAKRDQVRTAASYVEALRDYWLSRADAEQLLAGRRPPGRAAPGSASAPGPRELGDGH
jgi:cobalt-zinc-cadmium efflux system outer membrane protein